MNNEPVAIRYDFDGYGYQYMDSGSGSDWQSRVKGEPLYAHPVDEKQSKFDGNNKVKELTDEEIWQIYADNLTFRVRTKEDANNLIYCAKAILRKAGEK
jgi:hypothetical protein